MQHALEEPRFAAAAEHFAKAFSANVDSQPDWHQRARSAVDSLESTARTLYPGMATLGDVLKVLKRAGMNEGIVGTLERFWGYAGTHLRHGSAAPPAMSDAEAAFVINVCAAGIQLLVSTDP